MTDVIDIGLTWDVPYAGELAVYAIHVTSKSGNATKLKKYKRTEPWRLLRIYEERIKARKIWRKEGCDLPSVWEVQQMLQEDRDSDFYAAARGILAGDFSDASLMFYSYAAKDWRSFVRG